MSRQSGLRKQRLKLALQWADERFDVPIGLSPVAGGQPVQPPPSIVLLEPAVRRLAEGRPAAEP